MLCPVCKKAPLKGRQSICSAKCRSARYRAKKQQRDTSQPDSNQDPGSRGSRRYSTSQPRHDDAKKLEQLVVAAVDRIVQVIERQGAQSAQPARDAQRVDMREQITSQAPKLAVGYRLVLPGHCAGDAPRLLPKRSRTRDVPWYSLQPFEYPDDIRLIDGCWYRLVWIDEQGQRIRLQPDESVPGLRFLVGPTQFSKLASGHEPATPLEPQPASASEIPPAREAAGTSAPGAEASESLSSTVEPVAPIPAPAPAAAPELSDDDRTALVNELAQAPWREATRFGLQRDSGDRPAEPGGLVFVLPPPPTSPPPESWTQLFASFPAITMDESLLLVDFVVHPELMMQIHYEERLAAARASGQSPPREPVTLLPHEAQQHLHSLFTGRLVRPHFWSLCKAIFEYVRQHGAEVLAHLPVPIPPLPANEQRWLETALTSQPKRTYMQYVCARQDALLDGQPAPNEPNVSLSSKERNQIRKAMQDLRAVMSFKRRMASSKT